MYTNFYQNRPGLVEDMTKHFGVFGSQCIGLGKPSKLFAIQLQTGWRNLESAEKSHAVLVTGDYILLLLLEITRKKHFICLPSSPRCGDTASFHF